MTIFKAKKMSIRRLIGSKVIEYAPVPAVEGSQYTGIIADSLVPPSSSKFIKFHPGKIDTGTSSSTSYYDLFSIAFKLTFATYDKYMLYSNNNEVDYIFNFKLQGKYIYANELEFYDFYIKDGYISWYRDGVKSGSSTNGDFSYIDTGSFLLNMYLKFNRDWNILPDFTISFVDNEGD